MQYCSSVVVPIIRLLKMIQKQLRILLHRFMWIINHWNSRMNTPSLVRELSFSLTTPLYLLTAT